MTNTLFDRLVELSGLSPIFAAATVRRSIERAGLSPEILLPQHIQLIIPELTRAISVFLGAETETRMMEICKLGHADDASDTGLLPRPNVAMR